MKSYNNKPENKSRTFDRQPRTDRQASLDIILQKRSISLDGNEKKSANRYVLQRKGGFIPQADAMTEQASEGFFGGGNYESIIQAVRTYHDNALIPADDYGRQFMQIAKIRIIIGAWERKHGLVSQAVKSGFFGISKQDKRRVVLNNLNTCLPQESGTVLQQGFTSANNKHQLDRNALLRHVNQGFSNGDRILKNSCEWIRSGKTKLYAVTPTGDSYARLKTAGKNPVVDEAFFPEGVIGAPGDVYGPAVSYNKDDFNDNMNVTLTKTKRTGGWNDPGTPGIIAVVNSFVKPQSEIWETLRHEVQHDADKHKGRDSLSGYRSSAEVNDALKTDPDYQIFINSNNTETVRENAFLRLSVTLGSEENVLTELRRINIALKANSAEVDLMTYKTEFRAYSYQEGNARGHYSQLGNLVQDQPYAGFEFSERQLAIFRHIYNGYTNIKNAWDTDPLLSDGTKFRQAVRNYWSPDTESFNKYNSVRVDDFYLTLDILGTKANATFLETQHGMDAAPVQAKETDPGSPQVRNLFDAIRRMDESDRDYILRESPAMLAKIHRHLDGAALRAMEAKFDLMKRLDNIRKSPLYGFSEAYIKMEERLLEQLRAD